MSEQNIYNDKEELEKFQNAQAEQIQMLLGFADQLVNRSYIPACPFDGEVVPFPAKPDFSHIRLFRLKRFVFAPDESVMEKLKSVYLSFAFHPKQPTLFFVIQSNVSQKGLQVYIGLQSDKVDGPGLGRMGQNMVNTFIGTFAGSELDEVQECSSVFVKSSLLDTYYVNSLTAIPSVKKDSDQKTAKIGLEQFIDVMNGQKYIAVITAASIERYVQAERKRTLENLATSLSAYKKCTIAMGWNDSKTVGQSLSHSTGTSVNEGKSFTVTDSETLTEGEGRGTNDSSGTSDSISGQNFSIGWNSSHGTSRSWNKSKSIGFSSAQGITSGTSTTESDVTGENKSETSGSSRTATIEIENKNINNMIQQVEGELKRLKDAEGYGLWECAAYFISSDASTSQMAANAYKALMLGDTSSDEGNYVCQWKEAGGGRFSTAEMCKYIFNGRHPHIKDLMNENSLLPEVTPTTAVSGNDLAYFLTLPLKSIPGLVVDAIAPFERTVMIKGLRKSKKERTINIGCVSHMGHDEAESRVELNLESFTKHCFISGSTGSGKSNTMLRILEEVVAQEEKIGFLVIEPAKGEYKKDLKNVPGLKVYTTNPQYERLLRLNPFRFPETIHVLEHVDRLLNIFGSCWELTAAMPALLKKAVEEAYMNVGWDLPNSHYLKGGERQYPTFATVVKELRRIIDESDYSEENKGNYKGALVTRVESLAGGILRRIFCSETEVSYEDLFDGLTIVDLSRLGSAETKTLIMGALVMILGEYRMHVATVTNKTNSNLKHITILEEAHNLLRNTANIVSSGGSTVISKSVEMISNAIAEMRTYGEGFVIVDQSPGAVDISAIKNTNTKIVMRLPEQGDCETMGKALALEEEQQKELSKLLQGHAVVMQDGWTGAVMVHIDAANTQHWGGLPEYMTVHESSMMRALLAKRVAQNVINKEKDPNSENKRLILNRIANWMNGVNEAKLYHFGRSHLEEMRELVEYYYTHYHLDELKVKHDVYYEYGRLMVALLACEDCWKNYLLQTRVLEEGEELIDDEGMQINETFTGIEAFRKILGMYLPKEITESKEKNDVINKLMECIIKYMSLDNSIVSLGGSLAEQNSVYNLLKIQERRIEVNL